MKTFETQIKEKWHPKKFPNLLNSWGPVVTPSENGKISKKN